MHGWSARALARCVKAPWTSRMTSCCNIPRLKAIPLSREAAWGLGGRVGVLFRGSAATCSIRYCNTCSVVRWLLLLRQGAGLSMSDPACSVGEAEHVLGCPQHRAINSAGTCEPGVVLYVHTFLCVDGEHGGRFVWCVCSLYKCLVVWASMSGVLFCLQLHECLSGLHEGGSAWVQL